MLVLCNILKPFLKPQPSSNIELSLLMNNEWNQWILKDQSVKQQKLFLIIHYQELVRWHSYLSSNNLLQMRSSERWQLSTTSELKILKGESVDKKGEGKSEASTITITNSSFHEPTLAGSKQEWVRSLKHLHRSGRKKIDPSTGLHELFTSLYSTTNNVLIL